MEHFLSQISLKMDKLFSENELKIRYWTITTLQDVRRIEKKINLVSEHPEIRFTLEFLYEDLLTYISELTRICKDRVEETFTRLISFGIIKVTTQSALRLSDLA